MSPEDEDELARRRAYDDFKGHLNRFLVDCGASEGQAKVIGRHLVWWAAVMAKTHGWVTGFVALACIASLIAVMVAFDLRKLIGLE